MPSTYKTPGVFVEEITKFPPSVASVETAIPAFIGYTQIAEKNGESLFKVPLKIDTFLEFEQYFGGPPSREIIIRLNTNNQFIKTERMNNKKPYLLYDSLRLFYANGGGICYIVSVGDYFKDPNENDIQAGLTAIEKYDEPTLIVCPDAVNLDSGLYSFQQQALIQCNKLQDRFLICDLLKNNEDQPEETFEDRVAQFRDSIGINYLKYGAAYTPWLMTSLPLDLRFRDVIFANKIEPSPDPSKSLALLLSATNNSAIQQILYDLNNARTVVDDLTAKLDPGGPLVDTGKKDLRDQMKELQTNFMGIYNLAGSTTLAAFTPVLPPIYQKIRDIILAIKAVADTLPVVVSKSSVPSGTQTVEFKLAKDIDKLKTQGRAFFNALATHHKEIAAEAPAVLLLANVPQLTNAIDFLVYTGHTLVEVPIDIDTRLQYRIIAAKKAVFDQLLLNATAGGTAALAATNVADSVLPAADALKTAVDALISSVGNSTAAAAITTLNGNIAAAVMAQKIANVIARSYIEEESAFALPADKVNTYIPVAAGIPAVIANAIQSELLILKQKANLAAASTPNPGSNADVLTAVTITVSVPREFAILAANGALSIADSAISFYESVMGTAQTYETTFDQSLLQGFGLYKSLTARAAQDIMVLPPSGGVAGVYASVDSNRGVWKAPANTSLSFVLGPVVLLNSQDQESLNVDANAGKSINAIRAFTGKGTLVWGSRTLAGNDNEWRYVPVRRFFNYAEESIKKATEPFVFEPNDINTWIRVKAMIENFLTLEWRRGALAGAKPTDAFYVKVGLGETMNPLDILEGRMIVEVGMAVVRPAEFIILRFSHKMQES